jgi:hypothetical protein
MGMYEIAQFPRDSFLWPPIQSIVVVTSPMGDRAPPKGWFWNEPKDTFRTNYTPRFLTAYARRGKKRPACDAYTAVLSAVVPESLDRSHARQCHQRVNGVLTIM